MSSYTSFPIRNNMLTLPVGPVDSEFSRTSIRLSNDQWAWHFLRLNPSYRRDYELWLSRSDRFFVAGLTTTGPTTVAKPSDAMRNALLQLDSRYFVGLDGETLGPKHTDHHLEAVSLGDYLRQRHDDDSAKDLSLEGIRLRSFDAPRSYGLGGWLDPDCAMPQEPMDKARHDGVVEPSWFFHISEPVWRGQGFGMAHQDLPEYAMVGDQTLMLGATRFTKHFQDAEGASVPPNPLVSFKICLDGYLKRQLTTAQRVVNEYREALSPGKFPTQDAAAVAYTFKKSGSPLDVASTRQRRNWYEVTVDASIASTKTFDRLKAVLKAEQRHLQNASQLTAPVRWRAMRDDGPDTDLLRRALCVFEMQRLSYDLDHTHLLTQEAINEAIYCYDQIAFHQFRGLPVPENVYHLKRRTEIGYVDRVREGLEFARRMINSEYEFLVS